MPALPTYMWLPLLAFFLSCAGTLWLIRVLQEKGLVDQPSARSSHLHPVPRGGGLAIAISFAFCASFLAFDLFILALFIFLTAIFWFDDVRGLSWNLRLTVQCFALGLALANLWQGGILQELHFMTLPLSFIGFLFGIAFSWLWYVNHFNFADGSDGLIGAQTAVITFMCAAYFLFNNHSLLGISALTLGASTLGFLIWNYPPARIFLGDVGSISLGFLTGYYLILLAAMGGWGLALSLPLWLWLDSSITLLCRIFKGKSPVEAHREHFYQRAAGSLPQGHKRVLHLFLILQMTQCLILGGCIYLWPLTQWPWPLISAGFAVLYFSGLGFLIRQRGKF